MELVIVENWNGNKILETDGVDRDRFTRITEDIIYMEK